MSLVDDGLSRRRHWPPAPRPKYAFHSAMMDPGSRSRASPERSRDALGGAAWKRIASAARSEVRSIGDFVEFHASFFGVSPRETKMV